MDVVDKIFYLEDKDVIIDKDWYYHAISYRKDSFIDMVTSGIKSPVLLNSSFEGSNGKYYVSLSKNLGLTYDSAYNIYSNLPMFIINKNIKTFYAPNNVEYKDWLVKLISLYNKDYDEFITKSILPFRSSDYLDEYQAFLKVNPKYIIGIGYNLYENYSLYGEGYLLENLKNLKKMVETIKEINLDLNIIDLKNKLEINKEKVLTLKI